MSGRPKTPIPSPAPCWAAAVLLGLAAASARAEDRAVSQELLDRLYAATVTVRANAVEASGVTVSSGVSLGEGRVVTLLDAPADAEHRVTLPGGQQADAKLRAIDTYSRLRLLEIDRADLPALAPEETPPPVGAAVFSAAAAGIEEPVVSRGLVGAVDRRVPGAGLPPLLQLDLRTTDASAGAAVVDARGRLLGIVAVVSAANGWTYAVPARHVNRLLRAQTEGKVAVLRRRRPSVGLTMAAGDKPDVVTVSRVMPGGPADRAGVRQGDAVLQVDGAAVRNVYQVVAATLKKQPGDAMTFVVRQNGEEKTLRLTLGGAAALADSQLSGLRQITVDREGDSYRIRRGVREVGVGEEAPERSPTELLAEQVRRFATVIEGLRQELQRRDVELERNRTQIESLQEELQRLRNRPESRDE